MAPLVALVEARTDPSRREWLTNVYPFYLHDLSQFAPDGYHLSEHGRWQPDHLPYWLSQPFCHPLVLVADSVPVGFAFVGEAPFPFMSPGIRFHLSEFFVLRSHRRSGVGRAAARAVLSAFSGSFELTVLGQNAPALAFWRSVLPGVATGAVREAAGPGVIDFMFSTAPA